MQTTFVPFQQTRRSSSPSSPSAEEPTPDWRLQKPFGTGLSRRPIKFVPATSNTPSSTTTQNIQTQKSGTDIANLYLSLVGLSPSSVSPTTAPPETCPDCLLPITTPNHSTSTAHLSALPHAHPPHPYDRSSKGLKVLISSGWDPDARVGLGPEGEGVRYPIKTVKKEDRLGVGRKAVKGEVVVKPVKMGVKEARKLHEQGKRRRGRLMGELGGGVDVEEVLNRKME